MAKAVLCPVCRGSGTAYQQCDPYSTGYYYYSSWNSCHGCAGKGWVEVSE